jgi:hypothetical protein
VITDEQAMDLQPLFEDHARVLRAQIDQSSAASI